MQISVATLIGEPVEPLSLAAARQDTTEFIRGLRNSRMLTREDEYRLGCLWRDENNYEARNILVSSHMNLGISMARRVSRGPDMFNDMTQQATMGLIKAATRFDPDRGFRFSTYAQWWVLAAMQEYSVKCHSIVQLKPSSVQRRLQGAMRRAYGAAEVTLRREGKDVTSFAIREIVSAQLGISVADIEEFEGRMLGSDASLNTRHSSDFEEGTEWIDRIASDAPCAEGEYGNIQNQSFMEDIVEAALAELNEREREVIMRRRLCADGDRGDTLGTVAEQFNVSRERVRQIEVRALEKMQSFMQRTFGRKASFTDIFA